VGKSRPGTFLKATAYLSAAHLCAATWRGYSSREINRAVFKLDNIDPKPGKLWERTKHWTVDDMCIGGAVLGAFLAINPRALPGVGGWRRFLGAATVGSALGAYYGSDVFLNLSPGFEDAISTTETQIQTLQYERLKQDTKAQEMLSRFGRLAFTIRTLPIWSLSINPFKKELQSGPGGMTGTMEVEEVFPNHVGDKEQYQIQVQFNNGELKGPDVELGYRAYKDSLANWDVGALEEWLEHLQKIQKTTSNEAQWVWHHLTVKEHEFYNLQEDEEEKDIIRRKLQLLTHLACQLAARETLIAYHIADTLKRLEQVNENEPTTHTPFVETHSTVEEFPTEWIKRHNPQLATEEVRGAWTEQKQVVVLANQYLEMHKDLQAPEPNTPQAANLARLREDVKGMKKNLEATGRVLRELEEQQRKADEY
jgi:hypothetical protein